MVIKNIYLILFIVFLPCCRQTISDIATAHKMVKDGMEYVNSPEAKNNFNRIENEKKMTGQLVMKIDQSNSNEIIKSKNVLLSNFDSLFSRIDKIIHTVEHNHGKDNNGEILNKRETKFVNQILLEHKMASELRLNIQETIDKSMKIIIENQLKITKEELPLKLNLFMEADGKSWEEYTFKDMPYSAIMPIFTKYKNDVILTKLLLLEELANKK